MKEKNKSNSYQYNQNEENFDIGFFLRIIWFRKKLVLLITFIGILFTGANTLDQRINRPVFRGSFKLLINDPLNTDKSRNKGTLSLTDVATNVTSVDTATLVQFLKSPLMLEKISEKHGISKYFLGNSITISDPLAVGSRPGFKKSAGILKVTLTSKDPFKGELILNDLSKLYLEASLTQRQQKIKDGLNFLNSQEPILSKKANELRTKLVDFRRKYSQIEPLQQGRIIMDKQERAKKLSLELSNATKTIEDLKEKISRNQLSAAGYKKALKSFVFINQDLGSSALDDVLLAELMNKEKKLAEAKSIYKKDSKVIANLDSKIFELKNIVKKNQINELNEALILINEKLKDTETISNNLKVEFAEHAFLIKEFNILNAKLKSANSNLEELSRAKENFQLRMAQTTVPWKIISEPRMSRVPYLPRTKSRLFYGGLISLASGIFVAFIRNQFDTKFHDPSDISRGTNLATLGYVPYLKEFKNAKDDPKLYKQLIFENEFVDTSTTERFFFQESMRNIITSLRFSGIDNQLKCIALTSSLPSEGKSHVNILLAKAISDIEKKVLLIDCDLRKPQVHKRLGINNLKGLSNLLADSETKLNDITQVINENLTVITSGIIPPDPTKLLSSTKMKTFVESLKRSEEYDYIIFDCTPILGISDALILSNYLDGIILLISLEKVETNQVRVCLNKLNDSGSKIVGYISNSPVKELIKSNISSSKYGYGYGYGYGYEYGYAPKDKKDENVSKDSDKSISKENEYNFFNKISDKFYSFIRWLDK